MGKSRLPFRYLISPKTTALLHTHLFISPLTTHYLPHKTYRGCQRCSLEYNIDLSFPACRIVAFPGCFGDLGSFISNWAWDADVLISATSLTFSCAACKVGTRVVVVWEGRLIVNTAYSCWTIIHLEGELCKLIIGEVLQELYG